MQHTVRTTIKLHSYAEGAGPRDWHYPYQARVHWRLYSRSDDWIRITVCRENLEKGNSSQYNKGAIAFLSFLFFLFNVKKKKKKNKRKKTTKENNKNETKTIKQRQQRQNGPFCFTVPKTCQVLSFEFQCIFVDNRREEKYLIRHSFSLLLSRF